MNAQEYRAPASVDRVQTLGWILGGGALLLALVGAFISPDKFYQSYLFSYLLVLGLTLGSLGLLMLQHLTGGQWGIMIRRPLEAATRNVWLVLLMFVPIVLGMKSLYSAWLDPKRVQAEPLSDFQQHYLTHGGFLFRAVIYFAIWFVLMWLFNSWSVQQDVHREDRALRRRIKLFAGPGIVLYVLAMTFAAIDWVMSLSPHWASTIYGFIFVAAQEVSALCLMILVVILLPASEAAGPSEFFPFLGTPGLHRRFTSKLAQRYCCRIFLCHPGPSITQRFVSPMSFRACLTILYAKYRPKNRRLEIWTIAVRL